MFFLLYKHTDDCVFDDFPKISDHFPKIYKDFPNLFRRSDVPEHFPIIFEIFRRCPKNWYEWMNECVFIYRTYHIVSQGGLQFILSEIGRQVKSSKKRKKIYPMVYNYIADR